MNSQHDPCFSGSFFCPLSYFFTKFSTLCYNVFMNNIVVADNLSKHYGEFHALKGISFAIREGECFGLLGHNGAGKSTTLRMLYGLSAVEEGRLTLFGEPVFLTPPEIKQRLGVVPQEDNLDPDLPVLENLEVYAGLFGFSIAMPEARAVRCSHSWGWKTKKAA